MIDDYNEVCERSFYEWGDTMREKCAEKIGYRHPLLESLESPLFKECYEDGFIEGGRFHGDQLSRTLRVMENDCIRTGFFFGIIVGVMITYFWTKI